MKKNPTKCTVKLRKHDERNEWYLYIEAYPVYVNGNPQPKRVREYLNRTITTPIFNKSDVERTNGKVKTHQPRRDVNGVIMTIKKHLSLCATIVRYGFIEQQKKLRNSLDCYTTHTLIRNLKEYTLTAQENNNEWHFHIES